MKLKVFRSMMFKSLVMICWVMATTASACSHTHLSAGQNQKYAFQELIESSLVNLPSSPEQVIKSVVLFCLTTDGPYQTVKADLGLTKELLTNAYERNPFYRLATIHAP